MTLYRSEADFFAAVDVESTETFDSIPSGTQLTSGGTITLDQVVYDTCSPALCPEGGLPWTVLPGYLEGDPVSPPNVLMSDTAPAGIDQTLHFATGKSVEGIGFNFIRTYPIPDPSLSCCWQVRVKERGSTHTLPGVDLSYDTEMPAYFGFHSIQGIERIQIASDGGRVGWAYDNVSRTEVVTGDPISSLGISVWGPTSASVGEEVRYQYWIMNGSTSGTPTLLLDSLQDTGGHNDGAGLGDLTKLDSYDHNCGELPAQSACSFEVAYTVRPGEENPLDNLVEVHYHPVGLRSAFFAQSVPSWSWPCGG